MGAPVSGLISRSVCPLKDYTGAWFASISVNSNAAGCFDTVAHFRKKLTPSSSLPELEYGVSPDLMADKSRRYRVPADEFKVDSVNRIKPGIAEATRAVLRRVPDHVFVRSLTTRRCLACRACS